MKSENKSRVLKNAQRGPGTGTLKKDEISRRRLILLSLLTLVIASALLLSAAILEIYYASTHLYTFGNDRQRIDNTIVYADGEQLIDMNALADFLDIRHTPFFSQAIYEINSTKVIFENGSSMATVNGIEMQMQSEAFISDEYCLVPISAVSELISGIEIFSDSARTSVSRKGNGKIFITVRSPKIEYETDISEYLKYITSTDEYIFTLANKQNTIGSIEPNGLVQIPDKYKASGRYYLLYSVAEKALEAMMNDMFSLGYDDVYVTSAYRSYEYQEMLFNGYIDTEMKQNGLTYDEAREKVLTYSSEPGKSEHQTGLCVDFTTSSIGGVVDDIFATTSVFSWLRDNSWKYGFIMRYPEDKVEITGYAYESWHYRFVGLEVASIIHQTGMCYEEYLENFNQGEQNK